MTDIAGASRYINNVKIGVNYATPSILGGNSGGVLGTVDILDIGRGISRTKGIGISNSARQLNNDFLSRTSDVNKLLSLAAGNDTSVQGSQIIIKAIRSSLGLKSSTDADVQAAKAAASSTQQASKVDIKV